MNLRFLAGSARASVDHAVPAGTAVPRAGEMVELRDPHSGEIQRWSVRTVSWDYTTDETMVSIYVGSAVVSREPSFTAYGD